MEYKHLEFGFTEMSISLLIYFAIWLFRPESGDGQGEQQMTAERNEEESPDVIYGTPNSSAFPLSTSINESLM